MKADPRGVVMHLRRAEREEDKEQLAIARALGRRGATLLLADVDEAGLRDSRHQLETEGHRVETYRCDVSDPEHLLMIAQQVDAAHGGIDFLINNAGVSTGGSAGSVPPADWHWIVNINLLGVVWGTNAFVPLLMKRGKGGHIVNTGSMASHWANPMSGPYNATKFAVAGYTETLRQELEPQGINVSLSFDQDSDLDTLCFQGVWEYS